MTVNVGHLELECRAGVGEGAVRVWWWKVSLVTLPKGSGISTVSS